MRKLQDAASSMRPQHTHDAISRHPDVKMGSERGFGFVFAAVFALVAIWPALRLGSSSFGDLSVVRWWSLSVAGIFLLLAHSRPSLLRPLNRLWFLLGIALSKVVTPFVIGIVFAVAVIPTAIIMRLRGSDLLRLKFDREAKSYWIEREPPGPPGPTMKNQY